MSTSRCLAAPSNTKRCHWTPRAYDVWRNIDTGRKRSKWIGQESRTEMETHFLSFGDEMTTTRWIRHFYSTRSTAERAPVTSVTVSIRAHRRISCFPIGLLLLHLVL